jgi:hypothetical protein
MTERNEYRESDGLNWMMKLLLVNTGEELKTCLRNMMTLKMLISQVGIRSLT